MNLQNITYGRLMRLKPKRVDKLELRPCPFCGGKAEFRTGGNYHPKLQRRVGVGVKCTGCRVLTPVWQGHDSADRVATAWNRRAVE